MLRELENDDHISHNALYKGILVFTTVLILYFFIGSWMEIKKFPICHETGVIIIIGILLSLVLNAFDHETANMIGFNNTVFFDILLPLIIFATGYNMRRKNFFDNIVNINKFGIMATLLTFAFYSLLFILLFATAELEFYNPHDYEDEHTGHTILKGKHPFKLD